jgi:3-methylcrotonyl-CoA carboxylase alpha subunit
VGYPLLVKAVAGGGGRGMRAVASATAFPAALAQAQREARAAFGDSRVLLERDLTPARHVEVQFLADRHGTAIAVGERDCSIQRRHQKLIEEAPAPGLPDADRARLGRWAVRLARAAGYVGAGTAEFLRDAAGQYYFLEVNARLQVEHPVTELVYGLDLVHWQLRIAAREPLTLRPADVHPRGHAVEARLYAEDPARGFQPSPGPVERFAPPLGPGLRHDVGVRAGDTVSRYYDTLLAKLIAHGPDRDVALARLTWALRRYVIQGLPTNQALLLAVASDADFRAVRLRTDYFDHRPDLLRPPSVPLAALWAAAAADLVGAVPARERAPGPAAPWHAEGPWRGAAAPIELHYVLGGEERVVAARPRGPGTWSVRVIDDPAPEEHLLEATPTGDGVLIRADGEALAADVLARVDPPRLHVQVSGETFILYRPSPPAIRAAGAGDATAGGPDGAVIAPTVGVVVAVHVRPGEAVAAGQPLVALEAMKIEQSLAAPRAGTVRRVACRVGDNVAGGTLLVELE